MTNAIKLSQYCELIKRTIDNAGLQETWIIAELSDYNVNRMSGHVYCELIEKDDTANRNVAKCRATLWRTTATRVLTKFRIETGQDLATGMKVLLKVSPSYHVEYGLSLNILDIDPAYTIGDKMRLKAEIINRLKREGVYDMNRTLPLPTPLQRIAVISATSAAGYQDFLEHLHNNPYGLKFYTATFNAVMQGAQTPSSVIEALNRVVAVEDMFDCVVIVRGGGATTDLDSFLDYELAANIAQFPLPIICGIGHTRDVSVIDEVANVSCKVPAAVADFIVDVNKQQLELIESNLRDVVESAQRIFRNAANQLDRFIEVLPLIVKQRSAEEKMRMQSFLSTIQNATANRIQREQLRLENIANSVQLLSPSNVLKRGYSMTRDKSGHIIRSASQVAVSDTLTTVFADGEVISEVKQKK